MADPCACPPLPGFPLIDSPLFPLLEAQGQFGDQAAAARQLHSQGYLLLDLGRARMAQLAARIRADLEPQFDLEAWRAAGGQGDLRLQDGWRQSAAVRELSLLPELLALLERFWGRAPFPFQTLNFPVGTRQHVHSDAVHFHSEPAGFMCGVWVALEDVHPDAGPLEYYPGSQALPYLQARDVGYRQQAGTTPDQSIFHATWHAELAARGLEQQLFTPRLGQALIWTANLIHGGAPVHDLSRSRWSQVTHYFFEGCRWYTPMLSDWPEGPVAWRQPLNVATGVAVLAPAAESPQAQPELDQLLAALQAGDLAGADALLQGLLEPLAEALPQRWQAWMAELEASGAVPRLMALLQRRATEPKPDPALMRWQAALQLRLAAGAVDQLLRVGPQHYLVVGWNAGPASPELVALSCGGRWSVQPCRGPRLRRPDVAAQLGLGGLVDCGFLALVELDPGESLAGLWLNGQPVAAALLDVREAPYLELVDDLLRLCQLPVTPLERLPGLLDHGLGRALLMLREPLQDYGCWRGLVRERRTYGQPAPQAEVTVVVPLYRRWDFVLGQLAGFTQDPTFAEGRARLLYVVDDPTIRTAFLHWCEQQLPEEGLDVQVLALERNSGFALACNCGVLHATTPAVCLLNSDVLPITAGWLDPLLRSLAGDPDRLVAPLLLYENGLLQHGGMDVAWPEGNGPEACPACLHPYKGLDPNGLPAFSMDAPSLEVPALSGAALLFERQRFLDLGGFDPVFGRGDFEDGELSLRWRRSQGGLWLVPASRLTHLERQSISREPDVLALWRQRCGAWLLRQLCPELQATLP